MPKKTPSGIKGFRRKLQAAKAQTFVAMKQAMNEASIALDQQTEEINALKRLLISERAQVIYFTDKYVSCLKLKCFDVEPQGFLDLPEAKQEPYVVRAVKELSGAQGIVPHDPKAAASADETRTTAKKLILPN